MKLRDVFEGEDLEHEAHLLPGEEKGIGCVCWDGTVVPTAPLCRVVRW